MLRPCKECGAEISSWANTCPRCGYPLWRERVLILIGPIFAPLFFIFGGVMYWDVQFGLGRRLNGPGPLAEPFLMVKHIADGATGLGVACVIFGLVMWRRARRQKRKPLNLA
jgi:hypothetical protein